MNHRWTITRRRRHEGRHGDATYRTARWVRVSPRVSVQPGVGIDTTYWGLGAYVWLHDDDGGCPGVRFSLGPLYADVLWMRGFSRREIRRRREKAVVAEAERVLRDSDR